MNKPKIEKIDFGENEQEVKRIWDGEPPASLIASLGKRGVRRSYYSGTMKSRYSRVRKLIGYNNNSVGFCSKCDNLNTHILKEQIDGAIIITRFCSEHLPKNIPK